MDKFDTDQIILVNENGKPIGIAPKLASHHANTPLHLGFSCYVFNDKDELLVTQRALSKKVWPGVWTNSVCGHPLPGEKIVDSIKRRLRYELGMTARNFKLILPDFRYKTPPFKGIIENEICPVYFAKTTDEPRPSHKEVDNYKWMKWSDYVKETKADKANKYSYWTKLQVKELNNRL